MSSNAIEGEQSYIEEDFIFSPSEPRQDGLIKPISKPILDPNESSYALLPKTHEDPRTPLEYHKHSSHQDQKEDQI
jgi:hypothetical protein